MLLAVIWMVMIIQTDFKNCRMNNLIHALTFPLVLVTITSMLLTIHWVC